MKDTDISAINKKRKQELIMKYGSTYIYFNLAYVMGLISFSTLYFFKIKIIFLTILIIIISIILLIISFVYWLSVKNQEGKMYYDNQKLSFLRLTICIFTYIAPIYCIIQEPYLIVSHYVSSITFIIVTLLAIIGTTFIKRSL